MEWEKGGRPTCLSVSGQWATGATAGPDGEDGVSPRLSGLGAGHGDRMSLWGHFLQRGGMFHVWEEEDTQMCA